MHRRTKINKQLQKHQPPSKSQQLVRELVDIELKFQESYNKSHTAQEAKAIDAIKTIQSISSHKKKLVKSSRPLVPFSTNRIRIWLTTTKWPKL